MLLIRGAVPEDAAAIVALWRDCGLVIPANDPDADLRFALSGPTLTVLAGLEASRLVGTVMVGHDGHRGWLYYLASAPDRRGSGIGRRLVTAAEDWLRARGVSKLQLMIRPGNAMVAGFYDRLGFEPMPRIALSKRL